MQGAAVGQKALQVTGFLILYLNPGLKKNRHGQIHHGNRSVSRASG